MTWRRFESLLDGLPPDASFWRSFIPDMERKEQVTRLKDEQRKRVGLPPLRK